MAKKKYIETPEKMWQLFLEYGAEVAEHPITVKDFIGPKAIVVHRELRRPLTMEGFENFVANKGLNHFLDDYFGNKNGAYEEFSAICSRIRKGIRQDQIEGGMAGIYNTSITQRLNNLTEKHEVTHREQPLFGEDE
tara:strand:+ start:690 stop:1097 length:408 start_codon:yes stop_codon:yes gene_type:complete